MMEKTEEPVIISSDDEQENDKQLVLYDPTLNDDSSNPTQNYFDEEPKALPCVGAFTVQCANCFKWRFIPSQEIYEKIRENILLFPFMCEIAKEWRPEISCDEVGDVEQDGSRLWAIDKPNIAQTPLGWERELRIRAQGSSKFADVYYKSPYGKRLRSIVEIHKYLMAHPEFFEQGVTLSQFSFQIPKPLQEDYVRKRPAHPTPVNPISWAPPDVPQLVGPDFSGSYTYEDASLDTPPVTKKARSSTENQCYSDTLHNTHILKLENPFSTNDVYDL